MSAFRAVIVGKLYLPGRPFKALKQRQVSSTSTGPLTLSSITSMKKDHRLKGGKMWVARRGNKSNVKVLG